MTKATGLGLKVMGYSGALVSLVDAGDRVNLEDIAVQLGRIPRFVGATEPFLSGIHHALNCELIAASAGYGMAERATCLSHDFHEAFTGDVPKPLKGEWLSDLQRKLDRMIYRDLDIPKVTSLLVHEIDYAALVTEAYCFGPEGMVEYISPGAEPDTENIRIVRHVCDKLGDTIGGPDAPGVRYFIDRCEWVFSEARREVYGEKQSQGSSIRQPDP